MQHLHHPSPFSRLPTAAPAQSSSVIVGTIQRIDYHSRELAIIAAGRIWRFRLAGDCQLLFDGRQAPLRCFQPLDQVRIYYQTSEGRHEAQALLGWEVLASTDSP
jgi:hypothetical protein